MARVEQDNQEPETRKVTQPEQPEWTWRFNMAWVLVPLVLLGMAYVLRNSQSSVTWEGLLDILNVHDRERYTKLFHLGLIAVFIVAAVRIMGKKDDR